MVSITFLELAKKVLESERKPLTAGEIWDIAQKKGFDKERITLGKTPWATIGARIYTDLLKKGNNSEFFNAGTNPRRFYLRKYSDDASAKNVAPTELETQEETEDIKFKERQLHPILTYYVNTYSRIYTKTIYHEKSDKKRFNQWLHPDIVGAYFPIDDWEENVIDLSKEIGAINLKLYSYELKRSLSFGNLRESFFQAVSNSSWANEGYLVAANISKDEEFSDELKRLSTSFGIGVIQLDIADPDSSEIIFPARCKTELDWETINKLATDNPDFNEFLIRVKRDLSSKEIRSEEYDIVAETPEDIIIK